MKRTSISTQKVTSVPSCAANNDALAKLSQGKLPGELVGSIKPVSPEVNRRVRTSAAMIGLAISMGASSILLHQQGDEAMAAESHQTADSTVTTTLPNIQTKDTVVSPVPAINPEIPIVSTLPGLKSKATPISTSVATGSEQKVKPGQALWHLSSSTPVDGVAIATSNNFKTASNLPTEPLHKVPSDKGIVQQIKADDTVATLPQASITAPAQSQSQSAEQLASELPSGTSADNLTSNSNQVLKIKQDAALNQLKEQRSRLYTSLAELRSEESSKSSLAKQPKGSFVENTLEPELPVISASEEKAVTIPVISDTSTQPNPTASPVAIAPKAAKENFTISSLSSPKLPTAIPVVGEPKAVTLPNLTTEQNQAPQESVVTPELQNPSVAESQVTSSVVSYQVKPGDTLDVIARNYGVSATELKEVNQLDNPNLIRVNQSLKIPQAKANTVAPSIDTVAINSEAIAVQEAAKPTLSAPTLPPGVTTTATKQPLYGTKSVVASAATESMVVGNLPKSKKLAQTQISQLPDDQSNPYVDRLRGEILRLREQYRVQRESGQANIPTSITVPTVTLPITSPANNQRTPSQYINPEFSPSRYNDAIQNENRNQWKRQPMAKGPVEIRVEPPPTAVRFRQNSLIASAPSAPDRYNSSVEIPVGRPVSPEIPPLPSQDNFFPNSPNEFRSFIWPAKGVLTSGYGWRWGRMHKGIDIAAPIGTPIVAAAPGVVIYARWNSGGYGNMVDIQHADGSVTRYAHNNRILVREGQEVQQGEQISEMGSTGHSTGPHLHFEVRPSGKSAVNPMAFLPSRRG